MKTLTHVYNIVFYNPYIIILRLFISAALGLIYILLKEINWYINWLEKFIKPNESIDRFKVSENYLLTRKSTFLKKIK